jgi:hypothetical protein
MRARELLLQQEAQVLVEAYCIMIYFENPLEHVNIFVCVRVLK